MRKNKFIPLPLSDSLKSDFNPGKGWYQVHAFNMDLPFNREETYWCLDPADRLAMVQLDLSPFRDRPLSDGCLKTAADIIGFFGHYGKEVILRPLYDRSGNCQGSEPKSFELLKLHISQLAPVFNENSSNIHVIQGVFAGNWGEMHGSPHLEGGKLPQLMAVLTESAPNCFTAVRTPLQRRLLRSAGLDTSKIALFNDGLFGSPSHLGTFGVGDGSDPNQSWLPETELRYMKLEPEPNGGETVLGEEVAPNEVIAALDAMSITYLNRVYDRRVLDSWERTEFPPYKSLLDFVDLHLGYRFIIDNPKSLAVKNGLDISFAVKNIGFGCLAKNAFAKIIVAGSGKKHEIPLVCDLKSKNAKLSFFVPNSMTGTVYLEITYENGEHIATANNADTTPIGVIIPG